MTPDLTGLDKRQRRRKMRHYGRDRDIAFILALDLGPTLAVFEDFRRNVAALRALDSFVRWEREMVRAQAIFGAAGAEALQEAHKLSRETLLDPASAVERVVSELINAATTPEEDQ